MTSSYKINKSIMNGDKDGKNDREGFSNKTKLMKFNETETESTEIGGILIDCVNDDELLIIFSYLSFSEQFRVRAVCQRWLSLIDWIFSIKSSLSFVDPSKDLSGWKADKWYEMVRFPKQYIKVKFPNPIDLMKIVISKCENIKNLDLECYDLDEQSLVELECSKLVRLNIDSCDGLTNVCANYFSEKFVDLKYLNLSCCTQIDDQFIGCIVEKLTQLIALNVCGSAITGQCLSRLNSDLICLNISYCWNLSESGISCLTQSNCRFLRELSINNFDFDSVTADQMLNDICSRFAHLQHLDMSFGSCTDRDFYTNSLTNQGFNGISSLKHLRTLIIRKICILDDSSLIDIMRGCPQLIDLVIDMEYETNVTDLSISLISTHLKQLQKLEISGNANLTSNGILNCVQGLQCLKKLVLRHLRINNSCVLIIIKNIKTLRELCLNGCRLITNTCLYLFLEIASKTENSSQKFRFEAIKCGILAHLLMRKKQRKFKQLPNNVVFKVSNVRAINYLLCENGKFYYTAVPQWI